MNEVPIFSRKGIQIIWSYSGIIILLLAFTLSQVDVAAQSEPDSIEIVASIFQLMERTDLPMAEMERIAENYFAQKGTGKGSGYKQYERWRYERKFHLDENGYFINPTIESGIYTAFMRQHPPVSRSTEPWAELGPDSWSNTSGWNPGIGRITSVAIHPANESIIYVSSPGGGIWKSINGGTTWVPLLDNINAAWMSIYNIRIDPSNQNNIYAAVLQGGVIKSTNAGNTWTATGSGPTSTSKVVVHPSNSNIILCTAANGIWRSTNAGSTWTQVHTANAEDIEFKPNNPDIIYASGNSNTIKRSTNNGISWTEIGAAGGITNTGRTLLGVTPDNPNIVYAVQANVNVFGRMYKSTDSGLTFITTVVGNPSLGTNYFGYDPTGMDTIGQAGYDMAICVNPANEDEVHIAGIICWKSVNGGFDFIAETEWAYPNNTGYNHADVHSLEWVNTTIYSSSDGGIYKSSNNGADWTDLSSGIGIRQVYRVGCAQSNSQVITIGSQDNGSSYRQTSGEWVEWLGGDGMDNMISPVNASIGYGTWQLGGLNKTLDGGQTRIYLGSPSAGNWITPLDMHPTNHNEIYGGWTGVYKSTDGGSNWSNISTGYINKKLNTLAVAESDVDYIYASANNKLYRTTNGGTTWDSLTLANDVTSIFISSTNPEKIWITLNATSNQVLFSTNMGTNFTSISSGLPALSARTVVVDEDDADGVYVGMNIGVYYRNNDEPSWVPFGTELPLVAINELEIHKSSDKIRIATFGRGVWENNLELTNTPGCTEFAYVPNGQSNTVSVVELTSNTLVTTISVGTNPLGVCHKSTGDKVFITNTQSDNISVINTTTNAVIATIPLPSNAGPSGIGITPDDARVFVANSGNGTVSVINTGTHAIIQTINVGGTPIDIQVTPDGNKAFVTDNELYRVRIINTSNYTIENTVNIPYGATHIRFTPDGSLAIIMNPYEKVYALSTATNTIVDSVAFPYGYYSTALCVSTDGTKIYAGYYDDSPGPGLGIVDISSFAIETYATGFCCGVGGLSTNGNGSLLYVTNPSYNKVSVINTSTYAAVGTFTVGTLPYAYGDFVVECSDSTGGPSICGTIFADSGGTNGNYSNDENSIETLCPDNVDDKIELTFTQFALESGYDYLKIFDGNSINAPPLHSGNGYTGTNLPGTFTSSHSSGCLTIQFTSDDSVTDTGWVANVECIPMNSNPPCDEFAYVPNSALNHVSVVNLQTQAIVTTIPVNHYPNNGCHSNDGALMYITNLDVALGASVYVISTATNTVVDSINIPGPHYSATGICISPDDSKLYVATSSSPPGTAKLYIIDASTNTISSSQNIGGTILSMQVTPDGSKLYAANNRRDSVWVFNTATNSIITKIPVVDWTFGLAISPDGSKVYVGAFDESIQVINTATNTVTGSIALPGRPYGLCITPDGSKLYAANYFIDSVSVINTATNTLIKNVPVGSGPKAINSSGDGTKMYVFNQDSEDISILQTSDDTHLLTFDGGGNVGGLGDFVLNCGGSNETPVCGTLFLDSGGANETYSIDEDIVTTFCPSNANQSVLVSFQQFNVETNWDALYVFNGNSINAPIISSGNPVTNSGFPAGGYYGNVTPGPFQSTDTSGCLTFRFLSDNSFNLDGWEATIECVTPPENDLCANAILIDCPGLVSGTNVYATFDTDEFCNSTPGSSGVWYKLIGNGDTITLTTCHPATDFDTQIHVFTGTCSTVQCVTGNDDDPLCNESSLKSTVEFLSVSGEEYYILVSGFLSSVGQFTLQVSCSATQEDNNCLHFDGVNDNVYGPSSSLFELVDGTIELWIKPENKATSQTFISYRNNAGSSTRYLFNFLGNLSGLGFWNGTSYATFPYSFTANQWYHLAFVDDGVNTKIYINGLYEGNFNLQFSSASGPLLHLVLGYDIPLTEYFKGAIDEVRIWSTALSANTIAENKDCGISSTEECLVAYYRFNQGVAGGNNAAVITLMDETANNLDASLLNFSLNGTTSNWITATNGISGNCALPSCPSDVILNLSILHPCLEAGEDTLRYYPTWRENLGLLGITVNGSITLDPAVANWTSSNSGVATIVDGHLEAIGPGIATISVEMPNLPVASTVVEVIAPALPPVFNTIPTSLASPNNECAKRDMPVMIIRYLPSSDGTNLDVAHAPGFFNLEEITLSQLEQNLLVLDDRVKFALEEGTRYRDYAGNQTPSYLGYRVVSIITVYEPTPRGPVISYDINGFPVFHPDHHSIFDRFDIEHYINDLGIKEIWIWEYASDSGYPSYNPDIHLPCNFRNFWESNMASPTTLDISNSNQDTSDLPVFDQTYIVYGQNIRRSQAEAIHNHGHQIERMIPYINNLQDGNTLLFWRDFVGQDASQNFITGRCGWTHMPPNTTTHYDYENITLVSSDIQDWKPNGGTPSLVNVNTWGDLAYIWPGVSMFPQRKESQWYIFWMQSLPGHANVIPHGSNYMTNWWNIIADWDLAVNSGFGLYNSTPAPNETQTVVVNPGNAGYGTLRSTIACAQSGSTITFSPDMTTDTLTILSPIPINKTINVNGAGIPGLLLNASSSTFAFDIQNNGIVDLFSLQVTCGINTQHSGIRNFGLTGLHDIHFKTTLNTPILSNHNTLNIYGSTNLLKF